MQDLKDGAEMQVYGEIKVSAKTNNYVTVLLNLPYDVPIMRRYMCSSLAPVYLFPPQELLALGGIIRDWKKDEVHLLDAIAEDINFEGVCSQIDELHPDIIVTISGFESFEKDMNQIQELKAKYPDTSIILFGHYPTHFPQEILEKISVDYIILGEPDLILSELYDCIKLGEDITQLKGVAYRDNNNNIVVQPSNGRIPDPNILPVPAYDLMTNDHYSEPFLPKPFGLIQTARGCPYQCNYCVKSFGTKLTALEPQRIIQEIKLLIEKFNIKSLRFIDDTFTAIPKRVIDICKLMIENNIKLQWSCLSRVDTVNEEMLIWMKKAGCKRINFGVESGSQRILDLYNKSVDIEKSINNLLLCKKHRIESAAFFLFGYPGETEEDLQKSIDYAIRAKINFIAFDQLVPYPGTPLFNQLRGEIDFSLFPYKSEFIDNSVDEKYKEWRTRFFRQFYFRPSYFIENFPLLIKNSGEYLFVTKNVIKQMWKNRRLSFSKGLSTLVISK